MAEPGDGIGGRRPPGAPGGRSRASPSRWRSRCSPGRRRRVRERVRARVRRGRAGRAAVRPGWRRCPWWRARRRCTSSGPPSGSLSFAVASMTRSIPPVQRTPRRRPRPRGPGSPRPGPARRAAGPGQRRRAAVSERTSSPRHGDPLGSRTAGQVPGLRAPVAVRNTAARSDVGESSRARGGKENATPVPSSACPGWSSTWSSSRRSPTPRGRRCWGRSAGSATTACAASARASTSSSRSTAPPDEAELKQIAETLLANPVIEDVELHLPTD